MKKLIGPLALAGFFAAMIGTSYASPTNAAQTDGYTSYSGETASLDAVQADYVLHLEYNGYVLHLEWRGVEANGTSTEGASDKIFDR
jgi:hypothetical protein